MIKAFTDGSIRNDEVEVAAVLCRKGKPMHTLRTHKLHLGTASEHMVYEVELVDLLLGLQLVCTTGMNSEGNTYEGRAKEMSESGRFVPFQHQ